MSEINLSRLLLTGSVSIHTPKIVLIEILRAHGIKYIDDDLNNYTYLFNIIELLHETPIIKIKEPFEYDDLKYIRRFVNNDVDWTKNKLINAFKFMIQFYDLDLLSQIPVDFNYGIQSSSNIYTLNTSILYALCNKYNISLNFNSNLEYMVDMIRYHIRFNCSDNNVKYNLLQEIKYNIYNVLYHDKYDIFKLLDFYSSLIPLNESKNSIKKISNTVQYKDIWNPKLFKIDDSYINIIADINDEPKNNIEAIIFSSLKYKLDISKSINPLEEYKSLLLIPYFPYDPEFRNILEISKLSPDNFNNPNLNQLFNPNFPKFLYSSETLNDLCILEGVQQIQIQSMDNYTILQETYDIETFFHGKHKNINNKLSVYSDEISNIDFHDIICFGKRNSTLYAYTYLELCNCFENYKQFRNPLCLNNTSFPKKSINKLYIICSRQIYLNESEKSYNIRTKLKYIIDSINLYHKINDTQIKDFINKYDKYDINNKNKIKSFFILLFELSMYMRGWNGLDSYPIKNNNIEDIDFGKRDIFVTDMLQSIKFDYKDNIFQLILDLPLIIYNKVDKEFTINTCTEEGSSILDRINMIIIGENEEDNLYSCMNISSNRIAVSCYYYMQLLKLDKLFNIQDLIFIS